MSLYGDKLRTLENCEKIASKLSVKVQKQHYEIELLRKAIIALVEKDALRELYTLNAHPDLNTWAEHWIYHRLPTIIANKPRSVEVKE